MKLETNYFLSAYYYSLSCLNKKCYASSQEGMMGSSKREEIVK